MDTNQQGKLRVEAPIWNGQPAVWQARNIVKFDRALLAEATQSREVPQDQQTFQRGTRAPEADGVYQLKDGRFARYWMGQWRRPNEDASKAAAAEELDGFPSPQFRTQECHRWTEAQGMKLPQEPTTNEHDHYNKTNFPTFIVNHGNWDIYANDRGYCAAIPTDAAAADGCNATHFGDMAYLRVTLPAQYAEWEERQRKLPQAQDKRPTELLKSQVLAE